MDSAFVSRLEQLGFFKYVNENEPVATKADFERQGWAAICGETGRLFHADAESLAEGGVGDFLREIETFLKKLSPIGCGRLPLFPSPGILSLFQTD